MKSMGQILRPYNFVIEFYRICHPVLLYGFLLQVNSYLFTSQTHVKEKKNNKRKKEKLILKLVKS